MDVNCSEDQISLQHVTRRFLQDRSPVSALRNLVDRKAGVDRDVWQESARLGWVSLLVPGALGGIGELSHGVIDAAIVAEECGRVVYSGPFMSVSVVAFAIAETGSDAQRREFLPGLIGGDLIGAWCLSAPGATSGIEPGGIRVTRTGDGFVLDGTAAYVQDAQIADTLLITAVGVDGVSQFVVAVTVPGITIDSLDCVDLGRSLANVRFESVRVRADALLGLAGGASAQVERQLQLVLALQCAESVGVIDRTLEFTLDYVKQRIAFGRPIGSFQALKHRLAEHAAQLEGAKAAAAYAAAAVQAAAADAAIAVSVAKSHCGRCGTQIIRDCLQMHGGIGMTWEHDIHFYLRRAVSNEALWGTPAMHHERLCSLAGL